MNYNVEEVNRLIRNRRSVFPQQYDAGKKVPDEVIEQILINATWAPTHKLTEPWHFVVFTGDGLKKFAQFQADEYKHRVGDNFKQAPYEKFLTNPLKASHIIAIGMKRDTTKGVPEMEELAAVACAVENIYLSVTAYGYGGYWTTGGATYNESSKSFFGLGEDDKLLGFFYIGVIAIPPVAGTRRPIEEKVEWIRS